MSPSCPISTQRIDSHLVRIVSLQVALMTLVLLMTNASVIALILLFDFTMRLLRLTQLSPFRIVGSWMMSVLNIAPKWSDESPKRFALYLGFGITLILTVAAIAKLTLFATVVAGILFVCSLLETLLDFCIGCKLYYLLQIGKRFFIA